MPDHQHPSPAGYELVERRLLRVAIACEETRWGDARDEDENFIIDDTNQTAADIRTLISALASERSARQAAEAERERLREALEQCGHTAGRLLSSERDQCRATALYLIEQTATGALASQQEGAGL